MPWLANKRSETQQGIGLGSRIAMVHNGSSRFTMVGGKGASLPRPITFLFGCFVLAENARPHRANVVGAI